MADPTLKPRMRLHSLDHEDVQKRVERMARRRDALIAEGMDAGMTKRDIAKTMGINPTTVDRSLRRTGRMI